MNHMKPSNMTQQVTSKWNITSTQKEKQVYILMLFHIKREGEHLTSQVSVTLSEFRFN